MEDNVELADVAEVLVEELHKEVNRLHQQELIVRDIHAKAKALTAFFTNKLPIMYGDTKMEAVLVRAQQQIAENSKQLSHVNVFPEMNHNELVGWDHAKVIFANAATLLETLKAPSLMSRGKKGVPGVGEALVSPEDRQFSQAEDDFITAVLRKESGATFGEGEFERERNKYIPGPFDNEALREQKRRSREAAIQALARGADRRYKMPPVLPPADSGITMPEWLEMTIDERRKFSK